MDFGVVSHAHAHAHAHAHKQLPPSPQSQENPHHGSVPDLKHQRSPLSQDTTWRRLPKMPRPPEPPHNLWPDPDDAHNMLSFSSSQPAPGMPARSITFSTSQDDPRRTSNGGASTQVMRGPFARLRGPFTPSQWMELEHQALIYKHLVANVPVPSNLLLPLRRSVCSYAAPGSYASNFLGWGPFHLGFSGSNDPEPGRCRRTDGKKWRCSRDAVPDQKYCERHINRGRHRSRKPVEGQNGHTVTRSTTSKVAPIASSSSASVMSSSSASISLGAIQGQLGSLQSNTIGTSTDHIVTRSQGIQGLSLLPPTGGVKSRDAAFSLQKQQLPFEELSNSDFGLVSSDSLLNPLERIPYMDNCYSGSFLHSNAKEVKSLHPLHQFMDDWPKDQSNSAPGSWSEELKSDWTQLSMSIPVSADFSSSSSSPVQEKSAISTPRPSNKSDRTFHMSLGMNHDDHLSEPMQKQSSWLPIVWENSLGGPLGEVLTSTTTVGAGLSTMKAWKINPQLGSSPTGVLHKSTFVSLSASSPPRADDKNPTENSRLSNELPSSALTSSAAIP